MLLQEGIQAVREKASFLERELREQLADARNFLEEERHQRRTAEASLARQLAEAKADASALRIRLATNEDTQQQHEVLTAAPTLLRLHRQSLCASFGIGLQKVSAKSLQRALPALFRGCQHRYSCTGSSL